MIALGFAAVLLWALGFSAGEIAWLVAGLATFWTVGDWMRRGER
jgi:hypothetical protein